MDNFIDRYYLQNLNQHQINNFNRSIIPRKQKLSNKNKPRATQLLYRHRKTFKELMPIPLKILHKIESEEISPNSISWAKIMQIPKPHKASTKKELKINFPQEH